jgi:glycosyltransferase involved in cell wall biosynthesis
MPAVSVCIPSYNYGRYLRRALESVLAQTWRDFEVIVVDNCSADDTVEVVKAVAREFPELRYERNETPVGMAENFNRALALATGRYVKILCADDWLAPDALRMSVEAMAQYSEAAMVTTGRLMVSDDGEPALLARYSNNRGVVSGTEAINRCLFATNAIGEPSAVMFRRSLSGRGFDERYLHAVDLEMWFHLLEQGELACIPEPLTMIRLHSAQATHDNAVTGRIVTDKQRLYTDYGQRSYVTHRPWNGFRWRLRTAYNAWKGARKGSGSGTTNLSAFVHPFIFFLFLPAIAILDGARIALGRWRARHYRRGLPERN